MLVCQMRWREVSDAVVLILNSLVLHNTWQQGGVGQFQ